MTEENLNRALVLNKEIVKLKTSINQLKSIKSNFPSRIGIAIMNDGWFYSWLTNDLSIMESIEKLVIEDLEIQLEMKEKEFEKL